MRRARVIGWGIGLSTAAAFGATRWLVQPIPDFAQEVRVEVIEMMESAPPSTIPPQVLRDLHPRVDGEVTGTWHSPGHMSGETLRVVRGAAGLNVVFTSSGCLSKWRLLRRATFSRGILKLSKPVRTYSGETYDCLVVIVIDGAMRLVPATGTRDVLEMLRPKGTRAPIDLDRLTFTKG